MDPAELPGEDVRTMLRDALRGFLGEHWSADKARSASPGEISEVWARLVEQGVASLGCDASEGGLREILVVMAELGRAACPAPMWSAALGNLALSGSRDDATVKFLEKMHGGAACIAVSFGALDPDRHAGSIGIDNGRATGQLRFVEVAASCTHLLVAVDPTAFALVELSGAGVSLAPTRAMGAPGLFRLRLDGAPARLFPLKGVSIDDLLLVGRLALLARMRPHSRGPAAGSGGSRRAFCSCRIRFGSSCSMGSSIRRSCSASSFGKLYCPSRNLWYRLPFSKA